MSTSCPQIPEAEKQIIRQKLARFVQEQCRYHGITIEELASKTNLSRAQLCVEEGLSAAEFRHLCRILWPNVEPHEVYRWILPPNPSLILQIVHNIMGALENGEIEKRGNEWIVGGDR